MMLGKPVRDRRAERREATRAEILDAAWAAVREDGLAALNLRDVAQKVGMQAPSLYEYFDSKHAIYDAMFAQGYEQFAQLMEGIEAVGDVTLEFKESARRMVTFCAQDPARFQLLFHRTIPGFEPTAESYAVSIAVLDRAIARFASAGITDPRAVDLWTALVSGLASQQIANDPGGDRWIRLVDDAVDMFVDHMKKTGRFNGRRARRKAAR